MILFAIPHFRWDRC